MKGRRVFANVYSSLSGKEEEKMTKYLKEPIECLEDFRSNERIVVMGPNSRNNRIMKSSGLKDNFESLVFCVRRRNLKLETPFLGGREFINIHGLPLPQGINHSFITC